MFFLKKWQLFTIFPRGEISVSFPGGYRSPRNLLNTKTTCNCRPFGSSRVERAAESMWPKMFWNKWSGNPNGRKARMTRVDLFCWQILKKHVGKICSLLLEFFALCCRLRWYNCFEQKKTYPLEGDQAKIIVYPVFRESIESIINLYQCICSKGTT